MRAAPDRARSAPRFVARAEPCADMPKTLEKQTVSVPDDGEFSVKPRPFAGAF
jgi:hypothetical protein